MSDLGKVSEEGSLIKENVGTQNENKGQFEEEKKFGRSHYHQTKLTMEERAT